MVHGAGEHVPDGPPRSQQPPVAVGWQRPSVKAETSTSAVALSPWLRGVEGGVSSPVRHGSHHHHSLPFPPAQATAPSPRADRPAAGAVLPAGSTADRLLLGSDLPGGRLGRAAALERVEASRLSAQFQPPAGAGCAPGPRRPAGAATRRGADRPWSPGSPAAVRSGAAHCGSCNGAGRPGVGHWLLHQPPTAPDPTSSSLCALGALAPSRRWRGWPGSAGHAGRDPLHSSGATCWGTRTPRAQIPRGQSKPVTGRVGPPPVSPPPPLPPPPPPDPESSGPCCGC